MTMTIGGWCIGNGWLAFVSARRWDWQLVYPSLYYLWMFGVTGLAVLFAFRDKLALVHPIAWLYFVTLIVNVMTALVGFFDWFRLKPARPAFGSAAQSLHRVMSLIFVLIVALLGTYGLIAQIGDPGTNGGVFPEAMSPLLNQAYASYALIIFITLAMFAYIHLFDFANKPGQLLYLMSYFAVGIPILIVFFQKGTGLRQV